MATNYIQDGDVIDYTPPGAVSDGAVVAIGALLGVALTSIAANATGSVALEGVFAVPKVSSAVIAPGAALLWDSSAGAFDIGTATPAAGDITGPGVVAVDNVGNGVTTLKVKFNGCPGTVH